MFYIEYIPKTLFSNNCLILPFNRCVISNTEQNSNPYINLIKASFFLGSVNNEMMHIVDWTPTLLSVAGELLLFHFFQSWALVAL